MKTVVIFFATGAWSGYFPVASGTMGTLVGVALFLPLAGLSETTCALFTLFLSLFGVWVSGEAEKIFNEKDSGKIVIDEIAGMFVTLLWIPVTLPGVCAGFLLFRFFDIYKPFPKLEKISGGWGVMLDDIVAGVISNLILRLLLLGNLI